MVRADSSKHRAPLRPGTLTLACLSLGLGLAELAAPRQMARWIGLDTRDKNLRLKLAALGAREIACGVGLLTRAHPATWAWARTAGDVMDLALLGSAARNRRTDRARALGAAASVVAVTAVDAAMAIQLTRAARSASARGISLTQSVTICRSPDEVYAFFRDFANLPTFMSHLEFVRVHNGRSRWRARGPLGTSFEWDAEVVEDRPGEIIAWRSLVGAEVSNRGRVRFKPVRAGHSGQIDTEMSVELAYEPPAGKVGASLAKLFGEEPQQQISADLRRLKQMLETGEVLHSDASIHRRMHPARPAHTQWQVTEAYT